MADKATLAEPELPEARHLGHRKIVLRRFNPSGELPNRDEDGDPVLDQDGQQTYTLVGSNYTASAILIDSDARQARPVGLKRLSDEMRFHADKLMDLADQAFMELCNVDCEEVEGPRCRKARQRAEKNGRRQARLEAQEAKRKAKRDAENAERARRREAAIATRKDRKRRDG